MPRFKIELAYDGAAYAGWQIQPNGVAVQEKMEQALSQLGERRPKVHGSGRTDQGVHARGQVAHADVEKAWPEPALQRALNALLPPDIRVRKVQAVGPDFHARRGATGKEYRYFIWNGQVLPPFIRHYRCHVRAPLDVAAMRRAADPLVGRHDFSAFSANPHRFVESAVRTLFSMAVRKKGREIEIAVTGDGFLYKMVRSLAGFLIRVGEGAALPETAREILETKTRTARVPTASPQGLFLWKVHYGPLPGSMEAKERSCPR